MVREGPAPASFKAGDLWAALALGAAGFLCNMFELDLGWGLHFMFGNALVFAFIRVLHPRSLVLAIAISSLRSVFLWNHPWAWLIWTLEAGFLAYFARKEASPVRSDVLYWLLVGTPLLLVTYGLVMGMDQLSLSLVIAKQATNGVLNVVIGELIYLAIISMKRPARWANWPRMPIESFAMMLLQAIILMPTTVYLYLDAPSREQAVRTIVDDALQQRLQISSSTIGMWAESRAAMLGMVADKQPAMGQTAPVSLPENLRREFAAVGIVMKDGPAQWSDAPGWVDKTTLQRLASRHLARPDGVRLVSTGVQGGTLQTELVLIVPSGASARPAAIIAPVRPGVLMQSLPLPVDNPVSGTFLVNAARDIIPLSPADPSVLVRVHDMPENLGKAALKDAVLVSNIAYGRALMSDLRDAQMIRATPVAGLPDWQVLSIASLAPEVLAAREGQVELFLALSAFVLLVTLIASVLSRNTKRSLRRLARSVADLAVLGTQRDKIDSLVIAELSDISGRIASASSMVSRDRGALISYQRRLDSIARHAPILVYAIDVQNRKKGGLLYVSEAIERITGYTRGEATISGWWGHAIHPEDYDRCLALFGDLQLGNVITAEYRLRHKLGHYIWVSDTLAVEASASSDQTEAVGVVIDITERKAASEQLQQADKMVSLGRMISGTAHELNQPLNFIKMAATNLRERARRGQVDADRLITKLDSILSHVTRASGIILQMRIFGRIPREEPFPIEVKAAIDQVLAMAAPQLELDGTLVETSDCAPGVMIRALPVLLEQVLLNLVLNANDAIRVRRKTGDARDGLIRICVSKRDALAIVTVEDNGTGLPADILPMIFEPFFTTKPPKEGTGLGLPISYGIIRDLGGTIQAANIEQGARFIIELPLAE